MYGDSAAIRGRARALRDQSVDVRAMADRLVGQIEQIGWDGRAARDLRERIRDRAAQLRDCAAQHETAAESLEKHLGETDRLKDAIAERQRKADSLVTEARNRIAALRASDDSEAGVSVDPTDEDVTLDRFDPPPAGHKDWLTVELPGL